MTISPRAGPAVFNVPGSLKTRAITSVGSNADSTFLTGSYVRSGEANKIYLLEYACESQQLELKTSYSFGHAVFDVASHKGDSNVFGALCTGKGDGELLTLVRLPSNNVGDGLLVVDEVSINIGGRSVAMTSPEEIAVASTNGITIVRPGTTSPVVTKLDIDDCQAIVADPNRESTIVFASGRSLLLWDTRTKEPSTILKTSHFFPILGCDANPVLENVFVSGGADGRVMFWDIRRPNSVPLDELAAHNDHVTSVKYHPVHDQLVITSGTDCAVKLWRCPSVSSTPSKAKPLTEVSKAVIASSVEDGLIEAFTRHEDSVYNCCWGSDGWSFASVSFDGIVMANEVPRSEKYRIML